MWRVLDGLPTRAPTEAGLGVVLRRAALEFQLEERIAPSDRADGTMRTLERLPGAAAAVSRM
eukprot:565008-Prymnesium_polylepis.1